MKKLKAIFMLMTVVSFCAFTVSCGDDEPEPAPPSGTQLPGTTTPDSPDDTPTNPFDPTATYNVKAATLTSGDFSTDKGLTVYEDFYVMYKLTLYGGKIFLNGFVRENGYWSSRCYFYSYALYWCTYFSNLTSFGEVNNLNEITETLSLSQNPDAYRPDLDGIMAAPKTGYYGAFRLINTDEIRNIRLLVTGYQLDAEGSLASVNIQYQLYN